MALLPRALAVSPSAPPGGYSGSVGTGVENPGRSVPPEVERQVAERQVAEGEVALDAERGAGEGPHGARARASGR